MKKISFYFIMLIFIFMLSSCDLLDGLSGSSVDDNTFNKVTGKYYLYDNLDKRYTYEGVYFEFEKNNSNYNLKYYENNELKKEGKIEKLLTREDYVGKWADDLHFNVKINGKNEHICTYTESLTEINQFRIIDEYYNMDNIYYLSELPFIMGTYVKEGKEYKEEAYHTNKTDYIIPNDKCFTIALNGKYILDENHYFYFLNPKGFVIPDGNIYDSYFQYYSSDLDAPIEGFVKGWNYKVLADDTERLYFDRDKKWDGYGKYTEGNINFGYSTFDEKDNMIDHWGTVDFSNGILESFSFEHLSRNWTDDEWNKFTKDKNYKMPDPIIYDFIGGTYVREQEI